MGTVKPPLTPEIIAASALEPAFYFRAVLGLDHVADYQAEIAESVRDNHETAARSANGVGKSFVAAGVLSWWFDTNPLSGAFIAGPKFAQCHNTFRYMRGLRANAKFALPGLCQSLELRMDGDDENANQHWWVKPVTARDPESFAGMHEIRMLAVMEEASGLADEIYQAAYGCVTGDNDRVLHIGNPTKPVGLFANLWRQKNVHTITISAYQSPNVIAKDTIIPGLVGVAGVRRLIDRFGKDSDTVRVRVHGLPPQGTGNGIFSFAVVEEAKRRGIENWDAEREQRRPYDVTRDLDPAIHGGLDLARMGDDTCRLVTITDTMLTHVETWEKSPVDVSTDRGRAWLKRYPNGVLTIDLGYMPGVHDELLKEFGAHRVKGVNFGGRQVLGKMMTQAGSDEEFPMYADRRSELWFEAANWFDEHGMIGPMITDQDLEDIEVDLLAPEVDPTSVRSLKMERKKKTKDRIGHSPDVGDAVCLAVAGILGHGVERVTWQEIFKSGKRDRPAPHRLAGLTPRSGGLDDW